MLILLPGLFLLLAALTLLILRFARPNFKYPWIIALSGAVLAMAGVFLWKIHFPASVSLLPWQPLTIFDYTPTWLADSVSWPFALSLTVSAAAIILSSVVRNENDPLPWAGTLLLTTFGILAVSAGDPLTLILVWAAIDAAELMVMLRSTEGEFRSQSVVLGYAIRVTGMGAVIGAGVINAAARLPMGFDAIAGGAGLLLLVGAGLRLGVLPLRLPYREDNVLRRGFGTALRLVSAASSLSVLARIPASALPPAWTPTLLILTAVPALYAGWMWLRASDELQGRPFWMLGMAALAVASTLRGSPNGSAGWGTALVLCGGLIFLYSARQRSLRWLVLLGLWGLSALPFSPTASAWVSRNGSSWLYLLFFLPAQALIMAGYVRHALHPGETSLESQERWVRVLYPAGLFLLASASVLLGLWGWDGARAVGAWQAAIPALVLTGGLVFLALRLFTRTARTVTQWSDVVRLDWFYRFIGLVNRTLEGAARLISSTLEGEGGIFWSFLLLVLVLSLLSAGGR